jgi:hypothetical protein
MRTYVRTSGISRIRVGKLSIARGQRGARALAQGRMASAQFVKKPKQPEKPAKSAKPIPAKPHVRPKWIICVLEAVERGCKTSHEVAALLHIPVKKASACLSELSLCELIRKVEECRMSRRGRASFVWERTST